MEEIIPLQDDTFKIRTNTGKEFMANNVLMAIGRRGSPRKLSIPGEDSAKVAYRLLEPERITGKKIIVVGGGDSAVESALLLKDDNDVILSYRKDAFARIKPKNKEVLEAAMANGTLKVIYNSQLKAINDLSVMLDIDGREKRLDNDLVFIFAGGELPTKFLEKTGIKISKRFGYIMKKHN